MISEASRDIRWAMRVADIRRNERQAIRRPFVYLDELIVALEVLHLNGFTNLLRSFIPRLEALRQLLPAEIDAPSRWRRQIARVIDQCLDLQERVLRFGRRSARAEPEGRVRWLRMESGQGLNSRPPGALSETFRPIDSNIP